MRAVTRLVFFGLLTLMVPAITYAQASITGVVRDSSGAVLPGLTVEAESPALIEKVRTAVTDGSGQYRIVDLRSGVYTVTFSLAGFNTIRREGIELTGSFVATVNADMAVSGVAEVVTVTSAPPLVDVQGTKQEYIVNQEVINAIPVPNSIGNIAALVPGMVLSSPTSGGSNSQGSGGQDVGGTAAPAVAIMRIHGSKASDSRLLVDGLSVGSPIGAGGGLSGYLLDASNTQEIVVAISGGFAETQTGGIALNIIPLQGSNVFRGSFGANGATGAMQSDNYTQKLKDAGLRSPNEMRRIWDVNGTFGGPIRKDRLWFMATGRHHGIRKYVGGMFHNRNAGTESWVYEADPLRRAIEDTTLKNASGRLTWQATTRNKFNFFWDEQDRCISCDDGGTPTSSPESHSPSSGRPQRVQQATWQSPATNRLLFEAGVGTSLSQAGGFERPDNNRSLIRVIEQGGAIPGLTYRGGQWDDWDSTSVDWRASMSYVTGAHNVKVGYQSSFVEGSLEHFENSQNLIFQFNNGAANGVSITPDPYKIVTQYRPTGIYAQDQWTLGRVTLQGGVRYDHYTTEFPEQTVGPSTFIPVPLVFPRSDGARYNDITPRVAAAFDLFGTGKTAIKGHVGKYLVAQDGFGIGAGGGADLNPTFFSRFPNVAFRAWNDVDRDFQVDCNLRNPGPQLPSPTSDLCGPLTRPLFGTTTPELNYSSDVTSGWGARVYQWEMGAEVQHEIVPRVSAMVGYYRRVYGNLVVTDNLAVGRSDFTRYTLTAPGDPRLPQGGGFGVDVFEVAPAKFGQNNNLVDLADKYGGAREHWNGVDLHLRVRDLKGLTLQGGLTAGGAMIDYCNVIEQLPEYLVGTVGTLARATGGNVPLMPVQYCQQEEPFLASFKLQGAYLLPWWGIQAAAVFQSNPGEQILGTRVYTSAEVTPALGRPLTGLPNITVNLVEPGTVYGDRLNQLDLRFSKLFSFSGVRTQLGVDLYNVFNSSAVQSYNPVVSPQYLTPTLVLPARFVKLNLRMDF